VVSRYEEGTSLAEGGGSREEALVHLGLLMSTPNPTSFELDGGVQESLGRVSAG
jgi:hypothetical protein